jgi:hypothetical protein
VERRKILPLPGLELRPLGHPARSQSLYRLYYLGSGRWEDNIKMNVKEIEWEIWIGFICLRVVTIGGLS